MHSLRKLNPKRQYLVSLVVILLAAGGCYLLSGILGYKVVDLILLVTVSLIAMFFDMKPVLAAAVLSALVWNFFSIQLALIRVVLCLSW